MHLYNLAAPVAASVSCAICITSCLQSATETIGGRGGASDGQPIGEAKQAAYEDTFHFAVIVKDDGEGEAGGWQDASAKLNFVTTDDGHILPYFFRCPVTVGMPIRSKHNGRISAQYAARITAEVTTEITEAMMHERDWRGEGEAYCDQLRTRMQRALQAAPYEVHGTKVTKL